MNKFKKIFISSVLTITGLTLITSNQNISIANQSINQATEKHLDEIIYDRSVYNEEAEYVKISLRRLGYTDNKDKELYIDGYFGNKGKFALGNFLDDYNFKYFNKQAKDTLFKEAEKTVGDDYDSGLNKENGELSSTVFMYSDISNIDNTQDPYYGMGALKDFKNVIIEKPRHMSYNAKRVVDYVKEDSNVFGYINLGPNNPSASKRDWKSSNLDKLKSDIDEIADAGWYGVFIDQFGYDWGETRLRQNEVIDYAHKRGLSVMANAWNSSDALGSDVNSKANPDGLETHLNSNDWFLVESFYTDGNSYRADHNYIDKHLKTKEFSEKTGVNVTSLSYKRNCNDWNESITETDIRNSYILAHTLGFKSWSFSKFNNSNAFFYGEDPYMDLGALIKPLEKDYDNCYKYTAETEYYIIEYYTKETPTLNLIPKQVFLLLPM